MSFSALKLVIWTWCDNFCASSTEWLIGTPKLELRRRPAFLFCGWAAIYLPCAPEEGENDIAVARKASLLWRSSEKHHDAVTHKKVLSNISFIISNVVFIFVMFKASKNFGSIFNFIIFFWWLFWISGFHFAFPYSFHMYFCIFIFLIFVTFQSLFPLSFFGSKSLLWILRFFMIFFELFFLVHCPILFIHF